MKPLVVAIFILLPLLSPTLTAADRPPAVMPVAPPPAVATPGIVGSSWVAEDIGKKGVIDNARSFVRFDSAEMVSGSGGINRFGGNCTLIGDKLTFGPLRVTRLAGPPALMDQEAKFLNALAQVATFKLDEKDLLHLLDKDGKELVRLSRSDGGADDIPVPPKAPESAPDER
jgi:heat shock protein HslJ